MARILSGGGFVYRDLYRHMECTMLTLRRIGVFGGTFNPIHNGHLLIAEAAREEYGLEKVIFVPTSHPPHKDSRGIAANQLRYDMVRLAIEDNPFFFVSDVELVRAGPSYTVDTMRYFHERYPEDTEFYFIMGTDTLLDLPTWKYADELMQLTHFLSALRPRYRTDLSILTKRFGSSARENIHLLHTPEMEISATDLRRRFSTGQSTRYLLPSAVQQYIQANEIYQ